MNLPHSSLGKLALGLVSVLPLVGVLSFVIVLFGVPARLYENEWVVRFISLMVPAMFLVLLIGMAIAVYYLMLVFNSELPQSERVFWIFAMWFFMPVGLPVFWYRVVWRGMDVVAATHRL